MCCSEPRPDFVMHGNRMWITDLGSAVLDQTIRDADVHVDVIERRERDAAKPKIGRGMPIYIGDGTDL